MKYFALDMGQSEIDCANWDVFAGSAFKAETTSTQSKRVQMIEVNHVILNGLRRRDDIADEAGIVGNFDAQGVLHRVDRGERVDHGADPADPLCPDPGFARIAATKDQLDSAEHRARTPRIRDDAAIHLSLDAEVSLNTRHRIDHNPRHTVLPTLSGYPASRFSPTGVAFVLVSSHTMRSAA